MNHQKLASGQVFLPTLVSTLKHLSPLRRWKGRVLLLFLYNPLRSPEGSDEKKRGTPLLLCTTHFYSFLKPHPAVSGIEPIAFTDHTAILPALTQAWRGLISCPCHCWYCPQYSHITMYSGSPFRSMCFHRQRQKHVFCIVIGIQLVAKIGLGYISPLRIKFSSLL